VGSEERRDLARVRLAREVIGPDAELYVDANGGYTTGQVSGRCAPNLHAHVAASLPNLRHLEYFHDHQRIERMLFDGTLDPDGGAMRPDPGRPGHGMTLRDADAEPFRRA
jgi:L-alanine-DL-glutamate epimerase-like enolase superfamily enzyme